ncbi:MAG: acyl carrier protein [Clostridiales bacterium]|nr:MAG: acyl carrier protein [Clostridiales bacterium]
MSREKIKINGKLFEIDSIIKVSPHVIKIDFSSDIPDNLGDITIYTAGGIEAGRITGYNTVYRDDGQTIYLSDDGSVYAPPEDPGELPVEPYEPTLEELQAAKRQEVSSACERIIYNGVSVTLADGATEHFALTEHDQINLFGKQAQLVAGVEQLEYHADGQPCRYYSAADMQAIIAAALWHVSYHTTYCNALNMWIAACETAEDVQAIYYGADVPEEYQSEVLKAYLKEIADMAATEAGEGSIDAETTET